MGMGGGSRERRDAESDGVLDGEVGESGFEVGGERASSRACWDKRKSRARGIDVR